MKILKFGGTSVGSPERMKKVAGLVHPFGESRVVVLSAVSGTTNQLIAIASTIEEGDDEAANRMIDDLKEHYFSFVENLLSVETYLSVARDFIEKKFGEIHKMREDRISRIDKILPAQGELLSTQIFQYYLEEKGISSTLLPALEFMRIDEHDEPDIPLIKELLTPYINTETDLYITQGYICRDHEGRINNLKRGGSDYTASLIGAALDVSEVQIWTDIDGMHNNDPRIVKNTQPIAHISFDEAAELAYFGAKILHPSSILPAQKYNIPVRLKSTLDENAPGTLISENSERGKVKAIAAKDGITAIKIKSSRMLLAYGFLRKVFEIFEKHQTSIDMITTSEVAVSLTIDNDRRLSKIIQELNIFGHVDVDHEQTIICIVGNMITEDRGLLEKVFKSMEEIPVRMVSYGGSRYNISLLIDTENKNKALRSLNTELF